MLSKNKQLSTKIMGTGSFINRSVVIIVFLIMNPSPLFAAEIYSNAGTTGASFLKIGVGARAVGIGEAFVAVADDINSLYWNPAGLSQIQRHEVTAMHSEWLQGVRYEYIGYVYPLGNERAIGMSLGLLYFSDVERRTWTTETQLSTSPEGLFGASDFAGTISYSQRLWGSLKGGINLKYIYENIDVYSANDFALDIGLLYKAFIKNLNLGINFQNIGSKIKFREKEYSLPYNVKTGISYKITELNLLLALDLNSPVDNYSSINTGIEYSYDNITGRVGYRYKQFGNDLGDLSGLTAGAGFNISKLLDLFNDSVDLQLDYAFVPFGDLGFTHRISLSGKFGTLEPVRKRTSPRRKY